jgi:TadE-like protein
MLASFSLRSARAATRLSRTRRRGVTVVESALVLSVFLLLLFGMFEYCRFLLVLHVSNNAARDGARYASVNLDKPSTFGTADYTDGSGRVYISVQKYTTAKMGGTENNIAGFRVAVFAVDQAGLDLVPPVVRPKTKTVGVYPDPFNASDPNAVAWNLAQFPDRIAVYINGNYQPILPTFLLMPTSIPINAYRNGEWLRPLPLCFSPRVRASRGAGASPTSTGAC